MAGHDLAGSYQKAYDWCAIWSAFVWRFGFLFSGYSGIAISQWHWSCQCLGCPTSHLLCWPQGDDRSWLVPKRSQYDSDSGVVVYNKMHVWILHEWFYELIFQRIRFHCHHGVHWKLELFSLVIWLLEQYFDLKSGWVFCFGYRDHLIYALQRKLQITWKQTTMNSHSLFRYNYSLSIVIHCGHMVYFPILFSSLKCWTHDLSPPWGLKSLEMF